MKNSKNIVLGAVLLTGVFAMAAPASADYYRRADFRNDRREFYQDRREIWQDRREVSQDRRELRNDRSWWHW